MGRLNNSRATRSNSRKMIRRFIFFALAGGFLFVAPFAVISLYDLARPISDPFPLESPTVIQVAPRDAAEKKPDESLPTSDNARQTSSTAAVVSTPAKKPSIDDIAGRIVPIAEPSTLSLELRPLAEGWNRDVERLRASLATFCESLQDTEGKPAGEMNTLSSARWRLQKKFETMTPEDRRALLPREGPPSWMIDFDKALLKVAMERIAWDEAARCCERLAKLLPEKSDYWWDREVYCWRRCGGLPGPIFVATHSIGRAWESFQERLQ